MPDHVVPRDAQGAQIARLRAENEQLREAIEAHRAEILMDGESDFDVNEADEKLWRLIPPVATDENQDGGTDGHSR